MGVRVFLDFRSNLSAVRLFGTAQVPGFCWVKDRQSDSKRRYG